MRSNGCCRRPAITLIEVVAGLTLLSMVLVMSLVAMQRHEQQVKQSTLKQQAVRVADELLATWNATTGILPVAATGQVVVGKETLDWQTQPFAVAGVGVSGVRLTIRQRGAVSELVSVEVLATPPPMLEVPPA